MTKAQSIESLSREDLENFEAKQPQPKIPLEILADADAYHVDLEKLELVEKTTPKPEPLQGQNVPLVKVEEQPKELRQARMSDFLKEIDIPLFETANKVFEQSDCPIVIVSDDCVEYLNPAFVKLIEAQACQDVLHEKFLKLVVRDDWEKVVANIGSMLMNHQTMVFRLLTRQNHMVKMKFEALYLSDNQHFSFILIGKRLESQQRLVSRLYDEETNLPNFYLFEDRVQVVVNYENYKDVRQRKNVIAVVAVSLDNMEHFEKIELKNWVLKKLSERLVLSLRKTYSVARGLKCHFWILLPDLNDEESLKLELHKIQKVFSEAVADNFTSHEIFASIGVSFFPDPASSAKKLIEQAALAVQKAHNDGGNRVQIFGL